MNGEFSCRQASIGEIMAPPNLLDVPVFQRDYDWKVREGLRLLEDIREAQEANEESPRTANYFLGLVILLRLPDAQASPGAVRFQIIDGQQRLATITILLSVLRDLVRRKLPGATPPFAAAITCRTELGEPSRHRLTLRGETAPLFARYVQDPDPPEWDEEAALAAALVDDDAEVDVFDGEADGRNQSGPGERRSPSSAMARIMAVRRLYYDAFEEAELSELEEVARFVLERCHVALLTSYDLDQAIRMFTTVNNRGRQLDKGDVVRVSVLSAAPAGLRVELHERWTAALSALEGADHERFFSHLRATRGRMSLPVIESLSRLTLESGGHGRFVDEVLAVSARSYGAIRRAAHAGAAESSEINRLLRQLHRLSSEEWIPPLMLWWDRQNGDPAAVLSFLKRLDRLVHGLRIIGISGKKRRSRMQQVRTAIVEGRIDAADSPLELTDDELGVAAFNLRSLYPRGAPVCKLVLFRINDELVGGMTDIQPADLTIEHVLPLKPPRGSTWLSAFRNVEERNRLANALGNLLLVPKGVNDRAGNRDYDQKQAIYFRSNGPPPTALMEEIRATPEWTPSVVIERDRHLLAVLQRIWGLADPVNPAGARIAPRPRLGRSSGG